MESTEPSVLLAEQRQAIARAARLGPVLDLACGRGRHALALAERGLPCVAMDRDPEALAALSAAARPRGLPLVPVRTDLETDHGIPVRAGSCGVILVFRFLFRPLAPAIVKALAPGGLLLYETFTEHQRDLAYGPRNPAFLLRAGELRALFPELEEISYHEGPTPGPRPQHLARLAARRPT